MRTFLGVEQLVDDDVVCVDLVGGELLDEAFRFVEGKELGDADADECCLLLQAKGEEESQRMSAQEHNS